MAAQAGGDGRAGIGPRLRAAREKKGLTLLQAAEKMHVDARLLELLEAEDFAALGAAVYARGHLRHYATLVDEDPAQLVELYSNSTRAVPVQPDLTRIAHVPVESDSSWLKGPAVAVLVAIAALGTLWWFMTSPDEKLQPTQVQDSEQISPAGQSNPLAASPGGAEPPATTPTRTPQRGPAVPKVAKSSPHAPASSEATKSTPAPPTPTGASSSALRTVVSTSSPTATDVASPSAATSPATRYAANLSSTSTAPSAATPASTSSAPPTARAKVGELTLKFSSDSWAEVYDAAGQRLFYDVGAASSAHTVRGAVPMRVVLGNAAGVALEFNGRPASIPSGVASDGSVRFLINAHGRAVSASDGG